MKDLLACCCGLDIHKESVVACLMKGPIEGDGKPDREIKTFGTLSKDLQSLRSWLEEHDCRHVAMESSGIYWHPIYEVLETAFSDEMELLVVNARHMKNVPGKKTDMRDAEWIATLLRAGLLRGSFIPANKVRELRQLTRYRKALVRDITSQKNRIEKFLQSSGFRLSSFLSDIFGASGMAIMECLIASGAITYQQLDRCLKGRARKKANEIMSAVNGNLSYHQRQFLQMLIAHLQDLKDNLQQAEEAIHSEFTQFETAITLLESIPGISLTAAFAIIAEIGDDMSAFPTAQHICSWAGLAPGNHESAGKRKRSRVNKGNNYLKSILCEVAWVIASHRDMYLSTWYWKLKQRIGAKKAIIALARKLLVIIFTMLRKNALFDEDCFRKRKELNTQTRIYRMMRELTNMGYTVSSPSPA